MDNKNESENIELRSEKVRHIIGQVPPTLVRTGTMVITLVVIALAVAFYTIRYPITIEAQGQVAGNGTVELLIPYKYLYLFDVPRTASIALEGQDDDAAPIVCPITSHSENLLIVDGNHYFTAKTSIRSNGKKVQPGLKASAKITISDKTLWQQVFRK
ncbi:hypothetical protein [uncultured Prevotella sp.]|uniref:hypothetical protein n=1 Tax=uncultured Prevotella sp. TaxID=159272 RepID=UPI0025982FB6|nr:hypothetical protein [uncultured Prevotella sp.]